MTATFLAQGSRAESMRCGRWVVDERATPQELVEKCGEPTSKSTRTEDVYVPIGGTAKGTVKRGTTTIEEWTYERGSRSFTMVVTLVDGKIKSIERAR